MPLSTPRQSTEYAVNIRSRTSVLTMQDPYLFEIFILNRKKCTNVTIYRLLALLHVAYNEDYLVVFMQTLYYYVWNVLYQEEENQICLSVIILRLSSRMKLKHFYYIDRSNGNSSWRNHRGGVDFMKS